MKSEISPNEIEPTYYREYQNSVAKEISARVIHFMHCDLKELAPIRKRKKHARRNNG
jgi:hypothetical protein